MRRVVVQDGTILSLFAAGCAGGATDERRSAGAEPATPAADQVARECVQNSPGPWTSECSARWVRRVVRRAGYRVTGTTGSAWVATGAGREFFIWATERSGSVQRAAKREGYRLVGRVAGAPVYDDGVRKFWPADGFIVWLAAGPRGESIAPRGSDLAPIVRASRATPPPGRDGAR